MTETSLKDLVMAELYRHFFPEDEEETEDSEPLYEDDCQ